MIDQSPLPNPLSEPRGPAPDDFDESIFEMIGKDLVERQQVSLRESVRETLDNLIDQLGEGWIGGPPDPAADLKSHVIGGLEQIAGSWQQCLLDKLRNWSDELDKPQRPVPRSRFFLYLWWESFILWDRALAYRAVRVLSAATAEFAGPAAESEVPLPASEPAANDERARTWEALAWRAVCRAMRLIEADSWTFRQISLSSAAGLVGAADLAASKVEEVGQHVRAVLTALGGEPEPGDVSHLTWRGLRYLAAVALDAEIFYKTMADLARTVTKFEDWTTSPPRPDVGPGSPARPTRPLASHDELLDSVDASLRLLYLAQSQLKGPALAECEPWEQLLVEMRQIITSADKVFVPRRVWLRYCFPFAIDEEAEGSGWVNLLSPTERAMGGSGQISLTKQLLTKQLQDAFRSVFGRDAADKDWITVNEPEKLNQTLFFRVSDADDDLFGGIRVVLSELELTGDWCTGSSGEAGGYRCRVWVDLNQMGLLCLCVEPLEPMEAPPPHVLFRALRAGSPFAVGDKVSLVSRLSGDPSHEVPAWDNLDAFARDIIKHTVRALHRTEQLTEQLTKRRRRMSPKELDNGWAAARYLSGNSHLVAVVQTDGQFETQSGDITRPLDSAVGGRVLLRPIHRALSTLEEWIRLPPQLHAERSDNDAVSGALPEIGYVGDWFVHTSEMSIFGIVATPPWMRGVYPESAQFANSWSPVLRLWNRRLQQTIRNLRGESATSSQEELRRVEQRVRRRLAQINSEELCSTLTNRRFLDVLLDVAGVGRLQAELETHLESAEQLTDYYNTSNQQRSATRRDVWLFIIALLGIFSLGDFMLLANETHLHSSFLFINLSDNGQWEAWFILAVFVVALIIGLLFVLEWYRWLNKRLRSIWGRTKRGKLPAIGRKSKIRPI